MTPEKLREAAELLAQNSVRAFPKELESAIKLAADACTTLADMLTDASVDFEGFDECEGAAISKKTIDNPTPQNIYDYGKAVWQAALALCERNRAAQMESATHGFDEWVLSWGRSHAIQESEGDVIEWVKAAWHAAQAAMQAKLDAANERVKELEVSAQRDGMHFMPSTLKMGIHPDTIEELHLHDELCCDLVAMRMDRLIQDLKAALATAERERELLRGEVRRCWRIAEKRSIQDSEALDAYYLEQITSERSPEVRALVDAVGPSGATE